MRNYSEREIEQILEAWGAGATIEGALPGGNRNRLWAVRIGGRRYAARIGTRPANALQWEIDLLEHLARAGIRAPRAIPARDGRQQVDGLIVMTWLDGRPPDSRGDWPQVADVFRKVHDVTRGWRQRPGFRSSSDLLTHERGGDVRLDLMPPDVVERIRDAWRALEGERESVVHGDPGAGNILLHDGQVGFIDWDEARVDRSVLDLAALPIDVPGIAPAEMRRARRAALAWEVANAWVSEPEYARRRLEEFLRG